MRILGGAGVVVAGNKTHNVNLGGTEALEELTRRCGRF